MYLNLDLVLDMYTCIWISIWFWICIFGIRFGSGYVYVYLDLVLDMYLYVYLDLDLVLDMCIWIWIWFWICICVFGFGSGYVYFMYMSSWQKKSVIISLMSVAEGVVILWMSCLSFQEMHLENLPLCSVLCLWLNYDFWHQLSSGLYILNISWQACLVIVWQSAPLVFNDFTWYQMPILLSW